MNPADDASMVSFLQQGLNKISRAASRRDKALRAECQKVLDAIKAAEAANK